MSEITFGIAERGELSAIVELLTNDPLGSQREQADLAAYELAFADIAADPNQYLIVGRSDGQVLATLQLTVIPCLTHGGKRRGQIESVRVHESLRGAGVGQQMCEWAIEVARLNGCRLVQLTTDHQRPDALRFYEGLGFANTHHGLKLHLDLESPT